MRRHDAIRAMRTTLLRRREAICQSLDLTRSQLHSQPNLGVGDSVDFALDSEHHEISSQLAEVESNEVARIDVALERMAAGVYGVCEDCGRNIPLARLQAVPYTTLCVNCQRGHEVPQSTESTPGVWVEPPGGDLLTNGNNVGAA